jgi:cytidine deaminase
MRLEGDLLEELIRKAFEASARAYCPYSRFPVGSALLTPGDSIFVGSNVENGALSSAVAQGQREITAVVIATPTAEPTPPCGACRQVLIEFGPTAEVISVAGESRPGDRSGLLIARWNLADLLPGRFDGTALTTRPAGRDS